MSKEITCPSCGTMFHVDPNQHRSDEATLDDVSSMPASVSIASGCLVVLLLGTLTGLAPMGPDPWTPDKLWTLIPLGVETLLILGLSHRKTLARWTIIILSAGMAVVFLLMTVILMMPTGGPVAGEVIEPEVSQMMETAMLLSSVFPVALFGAISLSLLMPSARQWCNQ